MRFFSFLEFLLIKDKAFFSLHFPRQNKSYEEQLRKLGLFSLETKHSV